MNNNKGFTLVELLATIVLLGIIGSIAIVSVDKILEESYVSECENILLSIKSAAKDYASDKRFDVTLEVVSAITLIDEGYLKGPITNPFDKSDDDAANSIFVHFNVDNNTNVVKKLEIRNKSTADGLIIQCEVITGDSHTVLFPG